MGTQVSEPGGGGCPWAFLQDGEFTMLKKLSICAALSFLLVSSAMAQSRVCAADIKQACANIEPGGGRIAACVKDALSKLSDGCKASISAVVSGGKN